MPGTTTTMPSAPRGCAISSLQDISLPALSTSAQLEMWPLLTSGATGTATSSPGSAAGPMPSSLPDGLQTDLFGQALAPASPFPPQEDKAALLTSGIFGLDGFGSSASVALTQSLANRLRERLGSDGSTEFSQTWKRKVTPAGRRYWAHTASARRTSDSGYSGWPTPNALEFGAIAETTLARREKYKEKWGNGNGFGLTLGQAVAFFAGWPSPGSQDTNRTLEAWEAANVQKTAQGIHLQKCLSITAQLEGATPTQRDHKDVSDPATWNCTEERERFDQLGRQCHLGSMPSGSPASTARRGALSPLFSLWLMLGSVSAVCAWASCAPAGKNGRRAAACSEEAEMQSRRPPRHSSSAR